MVACTLVDGKMYVANIGDSRLYLIRESIHQITDDHSLVEELVKQGNLTESEALFLMIYSISSSSIMLDRPSLHNNIMSSLCISISK